MTQTRIAFLPDRGIVRVAGEDAWKLLQGVITNDMELLARQPAIHAGVLTPQGKILFEFFVVKAADGFLLETAKDEAGDLAKRLGMYKLRAKATIEDLSSSYSVAAAWGELPWEQASVDPNGDNRVVSDIHLPWLERSRDPRLKELGERWLLPARVERELEKHPDRLEIVDAAQYHAHRIALGVPEGGRDYAFGDTFPHEASFDVLGGISFTKGCFVGQEVVSRMQHRGTMRKRIVIVEGDGPLRPGSEVTAGQATVGTIGTVAGRQGLALLRLDRAREALDKGEQLSASGSRIAMRLPEHLKSAQTAAAP